MSDTLPLPDDLGMYDVVRVNVFYEEHDGRSKERPVIILSLAVHGDVGVGVKVTSNAQRFSVGDVRLRDWNTAGLTKPSVARCAQLVQFRVGDVKGYYGRLSAADAGDVAYEVTSLDPSDFIWLSDKR